MSLDALFGDAKFRARLRIRFTLQCPGCKRELTYDLQPCSEATVSLDAHGDFLVGCPYVNCPYGIGAKKLRQITISRKVAARYGAAFMLWGRGVLDGRA